MWCFSKNNLYHNTDLSFLFRTLLLFKLYSLGAHICASFINFFASVTDIKEWNKEEKTWALLIGRYKVLDVCEMLQIKTNYVFWLALYIELFFEKSKKFQPNETKLKQLFRN